MRSNWFTLSTTDNRALGAYLRQGLKPVDVYFELQAYKTSLNLEFSEVEAISTSDAEVEQIKAEGKLFGLDRADVYSHWRNEGDAEFFQLMSRGRLIGFGTILYNNNIDIWSQSSLSIGPVIVREATLLVDSLIALARVVKSEDALIRIMIPGNSSVANKLIHLGFKVEGHEILMTSDCVVPSNADAYVPSNFIFF